MHQYVHSILDNPTVMKSAFQKEVNLLEFQVFTLICYIQVNTWKEKLEVLVAHPSPAIQHRAAFLLRNLIVCGGREIALDIVESRLVELLDYLQHLPDISDTEALSPETFVLAQACLTFIENRLYIYTTIIECIMF